MVLLRSALKESGLRELERQATYAIERGKTEYAPLVERWFRTVFFQWTTEYGLYPERALLILLYGIGGFGILYLFPLSKLGIQGNSFVFKVWPSERVVVGISVKPTIASEASVEQLTASGVRLIGYAFFFSLLSAFQLGWRELNVGSWISRMQPHHYVLQAVGWVRVLSGFQSVLSVYLIAIWALTYFGRPFE